MKSNLAAFVARVTTPRFIYKGAYRPDHGETAHHYRIFNADGRELTSFVADSATAVELARRDKLEAISAAGLRRLPESVA